jgi:hypothetical protein
MHGVTDDGLIEVANLNFDFPLALPRFWKVRTFALAAHVGTGAMNFHDCRETCVTIQSQPAIENKAALSQTTT